MTPEEEAYAKADAHMKQAIQRVNEIYNPWQTIDSALKDETWVELYGPLHGEPHGCIAFWSTCESPGWYDSEAASKPVTAYGWEPTHWKLFEEPK
jgi:hypothetical protein